MSARKSIIRSRSIPIPTLLNASGAPTAYTSWAVCPARSTSADRQPAPPRIPAQIPPDGGFHKHVRRGTPFVLGLLRRRTQSHRSRETTKGMVPRQEDCPDRGEKSAVAGSGQGVVSVDE